MRAHNFFAGPAVLPVPVIEATKDAVIDFANTGVSIMEISHRSKEFDKVFKEAQNDALEIMGLDPKDYYVLFLGGGASLQFAMIPMNFQHTKSEYIVTGEWAGKAYKEAKKMGNAISIASSEDKNFAYLPKDFKVSQDADYFHYTTNNTIYGTEWKSIPDAGNTPLVCDMSSDFLSREMDYSKFSLIYAGAQKNIGPAGVVMIVVKKSWVDEKAKTDIPTMMKYKTHVDKESLFNTPPCLPVFAVGQTMKWIKNEGGLAAIQKRNEHKAGLIYGMFDTYNDFFKGSVIVPEDRSLMNITFNLPTAELEDKFIAEAKKLNMLGLKGHRSVGGIRASTYNACPVESCEALAKFMEEFYKNNK
jgi:phosphoserine aminotransferase